MLLPKFANTTICLDYDKYMDEWEIFIVDPCSQIKTINSHLVFRPMLAQTAKKSRNAFQASQYFPSNLVFRARYIFGIGVYEWWQKHFKNSFAPKLNVHFKNILSVHNQNITIQRIWQQKSSNCLDAYNQYWFAYIFYGIRLCSIKLLSSTVQKHYCICRKVF